MLKKLLKSFFLLSLVTVMMLSGTTAAFAESKLMKITDNDSIEGYMYFPDDLYVKAGSKVVLKSLKTTNGSFYQKGMRLGGFMVNIDKEKSPSVKFRLIFDVISKKNESTRVVKNFNNPEYVFPNVPNFYDDSFALVTLVAEEDLYISSYSYYK